MKHAIADRLSRGTGRLVMAAVLGLAMSAPAFAMNFHDFKMLDIDGKQVDFRNYTGKVVLVVNTASYCGYTGQFASLEALYQKYKSQGLVIVGFPTNDFLNQDPGTDADIKAFCTAKYQVSFPMFSKIAVTGSKRNPLYAWLTDPATNPKTAGNISWNFNKFLIGKDGTVQARFDSGVTPDSKSLTTAVEALLKG